MIYNRKIVKLLDEYMVLKRNSEKWSKFGRKYNERGIKNCAYLGIDISELPEQDKSTIEPSIRKGIYESNLRH